MRVWLIAVLVLALGGCQMALPGKGGKAEISESPITGGEIVVTALDDAAPADAPAEVLGPKIAAPDKAPEKPVPEVETAAPAAPVAVKTAAQLACEKRRGVWSSTGAGKAAFCQTPTRDGGKSCRASSDCSGYCLAKSGTCAPVSPMLGCHDILDDAGRMLTQCIN
ncbi:MAG: hypothetical protein JXR75_14010 [Rhodobacteraceae bacterium]|nr:hypothetical protein [Paracoccaceae bacterium]